MAPGGDYGHEPRGIVSATLALRGAVLDECDQLYRILGKSVATAKGKRRRNDESGGDAGRT